MMAGKVMLMLKARGTMKSAKGGLLGGDSPERDESLFGRWCLCFVQVFALVGGMHKITI